MATAKEIRTKIGSVKSTQKITRAMEMMAASKMRKAQQRMNVSRPYALRTQQVISHVALSHSEYHHAYFVPRSVKRVGFIVVSSDRGLCGAFNASLFKTTIDAMREWHEKEVGIELCLIGKKATEFFQNKNANVVASATQLGDAPSVNDIIGVVRIMLDKYDNGDIDKLYVVYNRFVSRMTQQPEVQTLLPLEPSEGGDFKHYWDYIYEPDARELLDILLTRYVESQVYQSVVENIASEQAARMVAMKSASDNAEDIIEELQLVYNKARQAAITQELSEIVAGAEAV